MLNQIVKSVQKFLGGRSVPKDPVIYTREEHGIDRRQVSPFAIQVCEKLQAAGYTAFIVGGAVRDLLIGHRPKDFDVATNATPEQVKKVTKRAVIIGRRFRLVHVIKGTETVEVSTFRSLQEKGVTKSESGRVMSDNVFGEQWEDAARRDFTVNAMFYDPTTEEVWDYHNGMADIRDETIRMIGDPEERYREDPVRIMRAVRIASKLGFSIDPKTEAPMAKMANLLSDVPMARLNDELLKIFTSGASLECLEKFRDLDMNLPIPLLDPWQRNKDNIFLTKALRRCDQRVSLGMSISPSFLYAAMMWPAVLSAKKDLEENSEEKMTKARLWSESFRTVVESPLSSGIQRRFFNDILEIWKIQPKFERRIPSVVWRLLDHPRFRAAYDFLLIRASSGEVPHELADWWTSFEGATQEEREEMVAERVGHQVRRPSSENSEGKKRRRPNRRRRSRSKSAENSTEGVGASQEAQTQAEGPVPAPVEPASSEAATKPRRRTSRRRGPGALLSKHQNSEGSEE